MASFAHVAVGMLAGRLHKGSRPWVGETGEQPSLLSTAKCYAAVAGFALLAMLPDADVLLVALGTDDRGAAGHRGASHSLTFAAAVGALVGLVTRRLGGRGARTAVLAALAVASHGLLDAVGEGGRGIPLLWPFSEERFMSPWRVLPDAPRGLQFLSWNGVFNVTFEFIFFLPFTAYSLWPRGPGERSGFSEQRPLTIALDVATATSRSKNGNDSEGRGVRADHDGQVPARGAVDAGRSA